MSFQCSTSWILPASRALADLDQPLELSLADVDAAFYQVALHEDVCLALRLRMGHANTVVFSVYSEGEQRQPAREGVVPVLADRSALPFLSAHLLSAARFLRCRAPVSDQLWAQLGINIRTFPVSPVLPQESIEVLFQRDVCPEADREEYGDVLVAVCVLEACCLAKYAPVILHGIPGEEDAFFLLQTSTAS